MRTSSPSNRRTNLPTNRVFRTLALLPLLFAPAATAAPQFARAQSVSGTSTGAAPAVASNPTGITAAAPDPTGSAASDSSPTASISSSSVPTISPETIERMRRLMESSDGKWPPDSFRPESAESIQRKLQTGEYTIDRNEKPWWIMALKLGFLVLSIAMFIVTLVVRLTTKKPEPTGPAHDEVRRADALAQSARVKYKNLVRHANPKNFAARRAALATEGRATELLFRQAADRYRAASEMFAQAAVAEDPSVHEAARLSARAYTEGCAAQAALADIASLLVDTSVTSAEEFTRRASPLAAAAKAADENCRKLLGQATAEKAAKS